MARRTGEPDWDGGASVSAQTRPASAKGSFQPRLCRQSFLRHHSVTLSHLRVIRQCLTYLQPECTRPGRRDFYGTSRCADRLISARFALARYWLHFVEYVA